MTKLKGKHTDRSFETKSAYKFGEALVAYQSDQYGCHRLALVNEDGKVIAAGDFSVYEHPCFATFGTDDYIGLTPYFDGEPARSEVVYRLEDGEFFPRVIRGKVA